MFKREEDKEVAEPYAEDAKQFVESRLLQRDVKIILEGVANQANGILLGTILHPVNILFQFFPHLFKFKTILEWKYFRIFTQRRSCTLYRLVDGCSHSGLR